jgi:serine/threonine protein phosphatase PrpC
VDDSWAAKILSQDPSLRPDEISHHPMRNVLTNVLGARETVDVSVIERHLSPGDVLLLCSDGVHGAMAPTAIRHLLVSEELENVPRKLVDAAMDQGSRDNVTALVIRYEGEQ